MTKVSNYAVFDNATSSGGIVQPFSLLQNENKQIWMTTHVPSNTVTGNYYRNNHHILSIIIPGSDELHGTGVAFYSRTGTYQIYPLL